MDKVLIADDDVQLLTILTESLSSYKNKFEVVTVKNGLEAILALQKQIFSAVVTEIRMPKVNGLVLLGYLSKNFPDLPCIIMTDENSEMMKKRLRKRAIHFLEKPFRIPELAEAILSVLDHKEKFGGKLNGVSVAGFMRFVEKERLSCLCEVSSPKQGKGYFLFSKGSLYHAIHGALKGEKAAEKMLEMKDATISFAGLPRKKISRSIYKTVEDIESNTQRSAHRETPEKQNPQPDEKLSVG